MSREFYVPCAPYAFPGENQNNKFEVVTIEMNESTDYQPEDDLIVTEHIQPNNAKENEKTCHKCEKCNDIFESLGKLKIHKKNHKLYKCGECNKELYSLNQLEKHKIAHAKKISYVCDLCEEDFETPDRLLKHIKYFDHKKIISKVNDKEDNRDDDKTERLIPDNNIKINNLDRETMFKYEDCGKVFDKKIFKKIYSCDICDKTYKSSSSLKAHKITHIVEQNSENNYLNLNKCNVCGKTFKLYNALKIHKIHHLDNKKYICNYCNKSFNQASQLKVHKITHIGQKFCNICGQGFLRISDLQKHRANKHKTGRSRNISNESEAIEADDKNDNSSQKINKIVKKVYKCNECGLSFHDYVSLEAHRNMHVNNKIIKCDKCGRICRNMSGLTLHKKRCDINACTNKKKIETITSRTINKTEMSLSDAIIMKTCDPIDNVAYNNSSKNNVLNLENENSKNTEDNSINSNEEQEFNENNENKFSFQFVNVNEYCIKSEQKLGDVEELNALEFNDEYNDSVDQINIDIDYENE